MAITKLIPSMVLDIAMLNAQMTSNSLMVSPTMEIILNPAELS